MNHKDLLEQTIINLLKEQDDRGRAIETAVDINNIEKTMYFESELQLFNKIYEIVKPVESYVIDWNVDFFGGKRAYVVFRSTDNQGEFKVTFDTDSGNILKIETTFSNQTVTSEFLDLADKLINLKR